MRRRSRHLPPIRGIAQRRVARSGFSDHVRRHPGVADRVAATDPAEMVVVGERHLYAPLVSSTRMSLRVLCMTVTFIATPALHAACGVDRWPVKIAADADAGSIRLSAIPTSIETLHSIPATRPLPQDRRIAPVETTMDSVTATLIAYRLAPDSNLQLILSDATGRTIVAQIPAPACAGGSRFLSDIAAARQSFERRFAATDTFKEVRVPIEVRGVGFFDFLQGQRGIAPNGLGIHPVLAVDFSPTVRPTPPAHSRRRAVRTPGNACAPPSLTISASQDSVCSGSSTSISWQASQASASVTIDGIGAFLPSSGTRVMNVAASTVYSGRATSSCGI